MLYGITAGGGMDVGKGAAEGKIDGGGIEGGGIEG